MSGRASLHYHSNISLATPLSFYISQTAQNEPEKDFYSDQLEAKDRFGNEIVFECPVTVECIRVFLDSMHGIQNDSVDLVVVLELIKFIMDLGKGELSVFQEA